ncbi:MAG: ABC transporter permease, partial [Blastocatellia bacterium]|nr:ABC transporter permease [Blastocatellia bacterium]
VLPPGFQFPLGISKAEVWTPTARDAGFFAQRGALILHALARLKPGINREQAQAEMNAIARQLEAEHPDYMAGRGVNLVPLHQQVVGEVRPALLILWGAVGLVLLVACANVANLLLVRGAAREKEVAVRLALGAGRWRLVRQLLTESVILAVIGGGLGLLLALWTTEALVAIAPRDIPRMEHVGLDRGVLGFALGLSVLTGLIFGLAPALSTSRIPLTESLKEGSRTSGVSGRLRLRRLLAVTETALAVVLLIGGGLLVRSFVNLLRVDPGFRPENVLTFQMAGPFEQSDADQRANFYSDILARLQALPGVQSVGGATSIPVSGVNHMEIGFEILGRPLRPGEDSQSAAYDSVTPDYFRTMGILLRQGRLFTEQDQRGRPGAVIINEAMARRYWREENPLGQRIRLAISFGEPGEPESYEIVGVVGDVHERGLDTEAKPHLYVPYRQQTWPFFAFALRTSGDPRLLIGAIRASVAELTRKEAVYDFKTMEEHLAASVARRRFATVLLGLFAGLALVLAAIGIYGVISHSTSQRTHEIAIRMALGAQRWDVLKLVLGQGMILAVIGVGIGLVAALMLTRLLSSLLFGVSPTDPLTFVVVAFLLTNVALVACYVPARRATRVDPMVALRYE